MVINKIKTRGFIIMKFIYDKDNFFGVYELDII